MYVRLAFAVAAHMEPEILIIDEVLAVGDAQFQKKCMGKMEDVSKNDGRTILFVSHNMGAIKSLCNQLLILNKGKLEYHGNNVSKGISLYLDAGNVLNKDQDFSTYEDENFKLLDFQLTDIDGKIINRYVSNDENIYVDIEFELKTRDKAFNIGYALYNEVGELIFWSLTTDGPEEKWPKLQLGKNKVRGATPKHFINEGNYQIRLLASLHCKKNIVDPDSNTPVLVLQIHGGLSESPYWYQKRPGLCAPVLEWEVL
jgi:lipopolysaccharide transport system ATP-binding protein